MAVRFKDREKNVSINVCFLFSDYPFISSSRNRKGRKKHAGVYVFSLFLISLQVSRVVLLSLEAGGPSAFGTDCQLWLPREGRDGRVLWTWLKCEQRAPSWPLCGAGMRVVAVTNVLRALQVFCYIPHFTGENLQCLLTKILPKLVQPVPVRARA